MLWRILTAGVVLFWALMTGLLVRNVYFPDDSRFAEIPPKFVLDLFLREAAAFNNTLHLYHEKEKIGHGNFQFKKLAEEEPPVYALLATGFVEPQRRPGEKGISWRLTGELIDGARWRSLRLTSKMPQQGMTADIAWKQGDAIPQVEVRRGGDVMVDSQTLRAMMALQSGGGGSASQLSWLAQAGRPGTAEEIGGMHLRAREGLMDLAGKQRKCYIIHLRVLDAYEINAYFTEVGELARVDLPEGYQLLEPLMHGLEQDLNPVE